MSIPQDEYIRRSAELLLKFKIKPGDDFATMQLKTRGLIAALDQMVLELSEPDGNNGGSGKPS
jgi:hypothetical protein